MSHVTVIAMLLALSVASAARAHVDGGAHDAAGHAGGAVLAAVPPAAIEGLATTQGGDCDDTDATIHPGQVEVVGNGVDDDCDGLADEDVDNNPSTDNSDADADGFTIAQGDCNDHKSSVHPGAAEIVGDLFDNDCDGLADEDALGHPSSDTIDHDGDGIAMAPDFIFADGFGGDLPNLRVTRD
jgi:hypothetical protein